MIPPIKRILYATDLSKNSIYAYYYAVDLAKKYGAEIVILNVIEPVSSKAYGSGAEKLQFDQHKASMEVIKNRLESFCKRVEARNEAACAVPVVKIFVQVGDPVAEILKAADEEACDLIFLGKHSRGFLAQTLLGSVSAVVLDRSRKPVFLVPLPSDNMAAWDEI
jgi:nucleotide-binding universal stress UspA family protein